jgi:hypothetical protein
VSPGLTSSWYESEKLQPTFENIITCHGLLKRVVEEKVKTIMDNHETLRDNETLRDLQNGKLDIDALCSRCYLYTANPLNINGWKTYPE